MKVMFEERKRTWLFDLLTLPDVDHRTKDKYIKSNICNKPK